MAYLGTLECYFPITPINELIPIDRFYQGIAGVALITQIKREFHIDIFSYIRLYLTTRYSLYTIVFETKGITHLQNAILQQIMNKFPNNWDSQSIKYLKSVNYPQWLIHNDSLDILRLKR